MTLGLGHLILKSVGGAVLIETFGGVVELPPMAFGSEGNRANTILQVVKDIPHDEIRAKREAEFQNGNPIDGEVMYPNPTGDKYANNFVEVVRTLDYDENVLRTLGRMAKPRPETCDSGVFCGRVLVYPLRALVKDY